MTMAVIRAYFLSKCADFVDFRYSRYLQFSLLKFMHQKKKKISARYQSYPKPAKMDAFGQEIYFCYNPNDDILIG